MKYCLISCGAKKQPTEAMARNLYTGGLFQNSVAWADRNGYVFEQVAILSAKYGFVPSTKIIQPYDLALKDIFGRELSDWANEVVNDMAQKWGLRMGDQITILAGRDYFVPLQAAMQEAGIAPGVRLEDPLKGLTIGRRMAWLKAN